MREGRQEHKKTHHRIEIGRNSKFPRIFWLVHWKPGEGVRWGKAYWTSLEIYVKDLKLELIQECDQSLYEHSSYS